MHSPGKDAHRVIKIVRVISRLNIGGPAIHTILLSSALNRDGYEDILVCGESSESEGDMLYLARAEGVTPLVIPSLKRDISLRQDMRAFLRLYSILKREKPDIIHTHTAKAGTLGRLAAMLAGVPIKVHTFHGHIFNGYFHPFKAKFFLLIERFLALFTDRVIAVSETVRHEIVNKLKIASRAKSAVIPLGLDIGKFLRCEERRGAFRKSLGLDRETLLVGIVGRLVPIKNHRMFIEVARKVIESDAGLKVKFLIIGDGELKSGLKEHVARSGLQDSIIFLGWVKDLAGAYADLDIVALTSLNEGTPVSIIEAMASGRAVIATNVGGVADLVDDGVNGFLAKASDTDGFFKKLESLAKDQNLRIEFGASARRSVAAKYAKERLIKDVESLYDELMRERSKADT